MARTWKLWFSRTFCGCGVTSGELNSHQSSPRRCAHWSHQTRQLFFSTLLLFCSVMAFMIGLPVGQIVLFCLAIGRDPTGLTLAVTNHELSSEFLSQQECPVSRGCNRTLLSCRYLDTLKKRNNLILVRALLPLFDFQCGHSSLLLFRLLVSLSLLICILTKISSLTTWKTFPFYSLCRGTWRPKRKPSPWWREEKHGDLWCSRATIRKHSTNDSRIPIPMMRTSIALCWKWNWICQVSPGWDFHLQNFSICQFQFFNTKNYFQTSKLELF